MTWGSNCPVCGQDACNWVHGDMCDGKVRALQERLAILEAAKAEPAERPMREQINLLVDESFPGVNESDRDLFVESLFDVQSIPTRAMVEAMHHSEAVADQRQCCINMWQAALLVAREGK